MPVPENPKIYHIVHVDRLSSIIRDGNLLCNSKIRRREEQGENFGNDTDIGISDLKERRLHRSLISHPGLLVGDCVPFYFCYRSIMLSLYYYGNKQSIAYRGGQEPIIHLESDMLAATKWAEDNGLRWAFTLGNASTDYCADRADLANLHEINWDAVDALDFRSQHIKEGKQAEFLVEQRFPWHLVTQIGVISEAIQARVQGVLQNAPHKPIVRVQRRWYY